MEQLYKVTNTDGSSYHGGTGTWGLPRGKRPGRWWKFEGDLRACHSGLHLCRGNDLVAWLGPAIWKAEHKGEIVESDNKVVVRQARLVEKCGSWNDQAARLFAADCAERVLKIANDERAEGAVLAARQFSFGLIDGGAWAAARAAAWDAAWDAAEAAARDAAWDAEKSWQEARLFEYLTGKVDLDEIRRSVDKS